MQTVDLKHRKGGCLFTLVKLAILAIVILVAVVYFCLGYIGDYAIKTVTAGTPVTGGIGSLKVKPIDQILDVRDFVLTNPAGKYAKENAISFSKAYVDLDLSISDAMIKKLIVIDEITIEGLNIDIEGASEGGLTDTNITEITNIIAGKYGLDQSEQPQEQVQQTADEQAQPYKFVIRKMSFKNGSAYTAFLGNSVETPIPDFVIENIGVEENGKTVGAITAEVLPKIVAQATGKLLKDGWHGTVKISKDTGKTLLNKLFGGSDEKKDDGQATDAKQEKSQRAR